MDMEFSKWLATLGVGGVLAALFYYQNRKDAENHSEIIRSFHEIEKGRTDMILNVVRDNTIATTKNNVVLDALHRRLDRDEIERGIK